MTRARPAPRADAGRGSPLRVPQVRDGVCPTTAVLEPRGQQLDLPGLPSSRPTRRSTPRRPVGLRQQVLHMSTRSLPPGARATRSAVCRHRPPSVSQLVKRVEIVGSATSRPTETDQLWVGRHHAMCPPGLASTSRSLAGIVPVDGLGGRRLRQRDVGEASSATLDCEYPRPKSVDYRDWWHGGKTAVTNTGPAGSPRGAGGLRGYLPSQKAHGRVSNNCHPYFSSFRQGLVACRSAATWRATASAWCETALARRLYPHQRCGELGIHPSENEVSCSCFRTHSLLLAM